MAQRVDAIIIGGGLIGATAALALARHGLSAIVVDRADLAATREEAYDGRVSAIASASAAMLRALGVGDVLDAGCPMLAIRVADQNRPGFVHFDAAEAGGVPLGWMVENRLLRAGVLDAVAAEPLVSMLAPASVRSVERGEATARVETDHGPLEAPLLIAADGRESALRREAGIRTIGRDYPSISLVTTIAHEEPHGNTACQIFFPGGPLAQLPMLDDAEGRYRSAIVWSVPEAEGRGWLQLTPAAFARVLERAMDGFLGELELLTPLSWYPLKLMHPERLVAHRLALIGDAGHVVHPVAGQGLNVGLRDVAALTQVLIESARIGLDLGQREVLARYAAWRRPDVVAISAATDGLLRMFGVPGVLPSAARRLGLAALNAVPRLKALFMAEARGELGDLPLLLKGELA